MPILLEECIIYEDAHLIVLNKPSGFLVVKSSEKERSLEELVREYVWNKSGEHLPVQAVHRLDRRVSGLLLFAKTTTCMEGMIKLFKHKKITKTYWAIVGRKPENPEGTLIHWLSRDRQQNISHLHLQPIENSQQAELDYRWIEERRGYHLIEVHLHTGRTHQIRAQLASLHCPIVGDYKYGYPREIPRKAIALHARELRFVHPVTQLPIHLHAELPEDALWDSFHIARESPFFKA